MQRLKINLDIFFQFFFIFKVVCVVSLLTVPLYGRQLAASKSAVSSQEDMALAQLVDIVKRTGLRFDLYQNNPEGLVSKLVYFFESESGRIERQDVQKVIDEVFNRYQIFGTQLRETILKNVGFVLRDNAVQAWVAQYGITLAQKLLDAGVANLAWSDVEQIASQHTIALPALHTRAHEVAIKSYVIGFLRQAIQQKVNMVLN